MSRRTRHRLRTVLAVSLAFSVLGIAQERPRDPAARDWIQLFNGRDLADWNAFAATGR